MGRNVVEKRALNHLNERIEKKVETKSRLCVAPFEIYARIVGGINMASCNSDNITYDADFESSAPRKNYFSPLNII